MMSCQDDSKCNFCRGTVTTKSLQAFLTQLPQSEGNCSINEVSLRFFTTNNQFGVERLWQKKILTFLKWQPHTLGFYGIFKLKIPF
jgi:hypothetical protein